MALYYNIVYALLVVEMGLFTVLSLPLPAAARRPLLKAISKPFELPQVQIAIKCVLAFILVLFVDLVNRVYKVLDELRTAHEQSAAAALAAGFADRLEVQARKFYAQRNMYLCGFTLFLTAILTRTYTLVLELMQAQEALRKAGGKPLAVPSSGKSSGIQRSETAALKRELAETTEEVSDLQEKAALLRATYDEE